MHNMRLIGTELKCIPMDGDIVNMVNHLNHWSVSFSSNNTRSRKHPVYSNHALCVARPSNVFQPYLQKKKHLMCNKCEKNS